MAIAVLAAGCAGPQGSSPASFVSSPQGIASVESAASVQEQIDNGSLIDPCHNLTFGQARCMSLGLRNTAAAPQAKGADASVRGFGPADLQAAYNIVNTAKNNPGGTVAVIEAGGNPKLESDLKVYRKQFGLPPCTSVNKCLRILNQRGSKGPLPPVENSWLAEQSLDVDMVSANCPNCKIVVIQCSTNLYTGIQAASRLTPAPVAISNSWGGAEYPNQYRADLSIFNHPGVAITASTGDHGYSAGLIFPSTSPNVTAIGGTSLFKATNSRGYTESVWAGAGSGCSSYSKTPKWQKATEQQLGGCSNKLAADVSYIGNPNTGVAVYESTPGDGLPPGWQVWGGTSTGAPAIAAIYALAGDASKFKIPAEKAWENTGDLNDITSGSNGTCSPDYLCTGEVGYDGPTGWGTPNGLGAF
ncbi:MAG TPA: S53 family peptidase [Candidatus Tumulicola sp.]